MWTSISLKTVNIQIFLKTLNVLQTKNAIGVGLFFAYYPCKLISVQVNHRNEILLTKVII